MLNTDKWTTDKKYWCGQYLARIKNKHPNIRFNRQALILPSFLLAYTYQFYLIFNNGVQYHTVLVLSYFLNNKVNEAKRNWNTRISEHLRFHNIKYLPQDLWYLRLSLWHINQVLSCLIKWSLILFLCCRQQPKG